MLHGRFDRERRWIWGHFSARPGETANFMKRIDQDGLDHYCCLEREQSDIRLLQEAIKGISDLNAKRTLSLAQLKSRHGR